ncbi:hypothetical protein HYN46_06200 [Aquirhabdus parva]|uniref:Uncharacterized protein n=2 Tax=Aquirhabdus parva TaxID=2283318 RepID=A0A345PBC6_9GAMM|nr:hypothetical protein HYN46_06200 [Aquirhabdus parva]
MTAGLLAAPILATAYVGVSVNVGQPGFYGQINLGDAPPPQLIYTQPMWVERRPVELEPIYLHVPYDHARRWRYYCGRYDACGRPVYFVRDNWYNTVYVPHYRERHYRDVGYRDDYRDYRHEERRGDWDRHGEGHGWEHDRGDHDRGEHGHGGHEGHEGHGHDH